MTKNSQYNTVSLDVRYTQHGVIVCNSGLTYFDPVLKKWMMAIFEMNDKSLNGGEDSVSIQLDRKLRLDEKNAR